MQFLKKVVTLGIETDAAETKKALNRYMAKCFIFLVSRAGVEPTTNGLKVASDDKSGDNDQ